MGNPHTASPTIAPTLPKRHFVDEALPHLDAVHRFASRLTGGLRAEAEDLVQDTFLQAYRAWESYTPGSNCRSWLFTICRNRFLRLQEQRGHRPDGATDDVDVEALAGAGRFLVEPADPERTFFSSFVDEEVLHAIDSLPVRFREAVVLSDMEGLTYVEISQVVGVPVGTVKSRLFRGRRLLQRALYEFALEMGYVRAGSRI
jgi:RNA polymerase sigma-70 factor, ECF subfamily